MLPPPLNKKVKKKQGFTLIELSVVLVVIGLLVGGVLVGQDLIKVAQARSLMSQMEKFQIAANTFRLKYNCKAGDCNDAVQLGLGRDGNGDGVIGGLFGTGSTSWPTCLRGGTPDGCMTNRTAGTNIWGMSRSFGEHQQLWAHLSAAGLIKEQISSLANISAGVDAIIDTVYPKDNLDKHYLVGATWNNKLYIRTGLEFVTSSFGATRFSSNGTVSASQMQFIASKFDYPVLVGNTSNHPTSLTQGQRVVPLASNPNIPSQQYSYYRSPELVGGAAACVVSDGAGGYRYNIDGGGRCDLLWELEY